MAMSLFVDGSVLDLIANHVLGGQPAPPEHEWAVDDLHFLLERFEGELAFWVSAPDSEQRQALLAEVAERYRVTWEPVPAPPAEDELVGNLREIGVPPARAPWLAACSQRRIRHFLQARTPAEAYRDRVVRLADVYVVDPMNCLSHLHARLLGRTAADAG